MILKPAGVTSTAPLPRAIEEPTVEEAKVGRRATTGGAVVEEEPDVTEPARQEGLTETGSSGGIGTATRTVRPYPASGTEPALEPDRDVALGSGQLDVSRVDSEKRESRA